MKKTVLISLVLAWVYTSELFAQSGRTGINTQTPSRNLDVNGSVQITSEISLGGDDTTAGDTGEAGYTLFSQGQGLPSMWNDLEDTNNETGTILVVNGEFLIAQELIVQFTEDYTYSPRNAPSLLPPWPLGKLNNVILDNKNKFAATAPNSTFPAGSNSFQVIQSGTYEFKMNIVISTTADTNPLVGLFNDSIGTWIVNTNDRHHVTGGTQSYTIITAVQLNENELYSFRANNSADFTVNWKSGGTSGEGPVSQVKISRLK